MSSRRDFLRTTAGVIVGLSGNGLASSNALSRGTNTALGPAGLPQGALDSARLDALSGKRALIKRTYRPPNYETPFEVFAEPFTPNDRFFVRYHHSAIPQLDSASWKLRCGGEGVQKKLELTFADLQRRFETVELPALCLCAGNRRGLFEPHVPGVQWGYGAMGNARWRGIRLRDLLRELGPKKEALEVTFDGADSGATERTPDFVKSLPLWKAMDEHTLIAFAMNGGPLPHWNGYPARLVVPGWAATYWVKHLSEINVVSRAFDGFWMKTAYRLPDKTFFPVDRFLSQETDSNAPVTELPVNSLITTPTAGQRYRLRRTIGIEGVAWDGGAGIQRLDVSTDGGLRWQPASLQRDLGRFAWRLWRYEFTPEVQGTHVIMARATNRSGRTQPAALIVNPSGYYHNAIQRVSIEVE